jgi:2'-5' RNA ligase
MPTIRTFIAVELDAELKATLAQAQAGLREQVPPRSVRWVQPDSIHLTLKFLGDTPLDKVEAVQTALARAAGEIEPFRFTAGGVGCFPNMQRPRVVWLGLQEPSGNLARLWKAVEAHVAPLGFPTESRGFSPHLTLGRVARQASTSEARDVGQAVAAAAPHLAAIQDEMDVQSVAFIKSDLRPEGPIYTRLFDAELHGQPRR